MKNIIIIIQARMGSTRFPGKVMTEIVGYPVLWHIVNRVQCSKLANDIVVATSVKRVDDTIEQLCNEMNINCYRGEELDVLDRYYQAAKIYKAETVVRITADCPLVDPFLIDNIIELFTNSITDFASNVNPPTFPDGYDIEIFSFSALESSWKNANQKYQREHVTNYITENPDRYTSVNFFSLRNLADWRLTIDYVEDIIVIKKIYQSLYQPDLIFTLGDVIDFIDSNPKILNINSKFIDTNRVNQ